MKKSFLILIFFGFFSGCDTYRGPIIQNNYSTSIDVAILYADGNSSEVRLDPRSALWDGLKGRIPKYIKVIANHQTIEFNEIVIQDLMSRVKDPHEAVFVLAEERLDIISFSEARKRGLR